MPKNLLHVSRGEEKYAFLYAVIAAVTIAVVMTYSGIAHLVWWQSALLLAACLLGAWATVFSLLEVRRAAQTPEQRESQKLTEEPYPSRVVFVTPGAGDPCPHHEDYPESAGFDQGQLTSRIPQETPLIDRFLARWRKA